MDFFGGGATTELAEAIKIISTDMFIEVRGQFPEELQIFYTDEIEINSEQLARLAREAGILTMLFIPLRSRKFVSTLTTPGNTFLTTWRNEVGSRGSGGTTCGIGTGA